jgi:pSer/pThr/pTyr-binding forkhead associated (FHA) protein
MARSHQPAASLTISRGAGAGRRLNIGAAPVTIGREVQCDVHVDNTWVSRQHARLAWTGTQYIVEDLGSINGTYVNGERVGAPRALQSGDRLQLGEEVELVFEVRVPAPLEGRSDPPGMAPSPRGEAGLPRAQAPPSRKSPVQEGSFLQPGRTRVWALGLLVLLLSLIVGGGAYYLLSDKGQRVADTEVGKALAPQPTATPTPTPTQAAVPTQTPSLIPGIDEPVTLEERGIEFLILGVDLEVGQEAGHTELVLKYGPPFDFTDAEWIAGNSRLTCGTTTYPTRSMGFFVGDAGRIEHFRLVFDVPEDINLLECKLQVTDGIEIPLASLPE